MALVYNTISASDAITQICSPDITDSNAIFGGHIKSWDGTDFDVPTINEMAEEFSISGSFVGTFYADGPRMFVALGPNVMTDRLPVGTCLSLTIGAVKYFAFVHSYGIHLTGPASYYPIIILLTYDDGWTDEQELTVSDIRIGGYNNFQSLTLLDKFNSATGFGVGSRRIIKLLNGEYDDCPSMDMSSGGVSIKGLDRNMQPAKCELLKLLCQDTPTIYLGDKETLSTVANGRQIKFGPVSSIDGVSIKTNNATTPAIVPPASGRNHLLSNVKIREYSTNAYPVAHKYTTINTLITESEATTTGFSFDGLSASELCCITPRGLNLNSGHNIAVSNLLCVTMPSGSTAYAFSIGSGDTDVRLGNVVCVSQSSTAVSRLFYSPGTGATTLTVGTMLIDGYGTYAPAGRTVGSVFVDKLAIRESFLPQLNDEVKYNRLIVIPDHEKIFLDKANFDFTVIHPVLLREGIGINKIPESILRLGDKY